MVWKAPPTSVSYGALPLFVPFDRPIFKDFCFCMWLSFGLESLFSVEMVFNYDFCQQLLKCLQERLVVFHLDFEADIT